MVKAGTGRTGSDDLSRGTNQTGVRLYNERLVLSLVRRHGSLPKADIARRTGLSPQTISTIANALRFMGARPAAAPAPSGSAAPLAVERAGQA